METLLSNKHLAKVGSKVALEELEKVSILKGTK